MICSTLASPETWIVSVPPTFSVALVVTLVSQAGGVDVTDARIPTALLDCLLAGLREALPVLLWLCSVRLRVVALELLEGSLPDLVGLSLVGDVGVVAR